MQVSSTGVLITPTIQKYLNVIASGKIEESTIIAMKSLMGKNKDAANVINEALYANDSKELQLSDKQNKKGIVFLLNQWKTPNGKDRKNNPFGYREQKILENFSHFTLSGFYDAGNSYVTFYIPIYSCWSKDGNGFEYYYNGEVNIIG